MDGTSGCVTGLRGDPSWGVYDRLIVELRNEDPIVFHIFFMTASCDVRWNCAVTDTSSYQGDLQLESNPCTCLQSVTVTRERHLL